MAVPAPPPCRRQQLLGEGRLTPLPRCRVVGRTQADPCIGGPDPDAVVCQGCACEPRAPQFRIRAEGHAASRQQCDRTSKSPCAAAVATGRLSYAVCLGYDLFLQPLRSKFCKHCQARVCTYDHHCFMIGTCIGERNHCRFWWLLMTTSITICICIVVVRGTYRAGAVWACGRARPHVRCRAGHRWTTATCTSGTGGIGSRRTSWRSWPPSFFTCVAARSGADARV